MRKYLEALAYNAANQPDAIAYRVLHAEGVPDTVQTYAQLQELSDAYALYIAQWVPRGRTVALMGYRQTRLFAAFFA